MGEAFGRAGGVGVTVSGQLRPSIGQWWWTLSRASPTSSPSPSSAPAHQPPPARSQWSLCLLLSLPKKLFPKSICLANSSTCWRFQLQTHLFMNPYLKFLPSLTQAPHMSIPWFTFLLNKQRDEHFCLLICLVSLSPTDARSTKAGCLNLSCVAGCAGAHLKS
jgi:hypothetical protein